MNPDVAKLDRLITQRAAAAARARDYYVGNPQGVAANLTLRLQRVLRQLELDYLLRFAAVPVDTLLDRLSLRGIRTEGGDADPLLDQLWVDNELDEESIEAHRWTLVDGDGHLLVWHRYDGEPDEDGQAAIVDGTAQITYLSALEAACVYDRDVPTMMRVAGRRWIDDSGDRRLDLWYPDRLEEWTRPRDARDDTGWEPVTDPTLHELGRVPVVHLRTRRPYGRPEHEPAFGPQQMITKAAVMLATTMDFRGFPILAKLTKPGSEVAGSGDLAAWDDNDEEVPTLTAEPGALWDLTADQLVQIAPADPTPFLDVIDRFVGHMAALTATPITAFKGWGGGTAPSGAALMRMEQPLIRRARQRQHQFGAGWADALQLAARIATGAEVEAVAEWDPPEQADTLEALEVVAAKIDLGVPARVALSEVGYRVEDLDEWGVAGTPAPAPAAGALADLFGGDDG